MYNFADVFGYTPYPFQQGVSDALLTGKNVILQAPTGAGKTYAALLPWLHAIQLTSNDGNYAHFPFRCIYSVPMRVLATQFHREVSDDLTIFANRLKRKDIRAVVQTGETPEDPKLENALIFATLDQTLSSALGIPYGGVSPNLNAGAVMSSYCVWDEFHLFGRAQALPTTLHWLKLMQGITPFCLMTATFSRTLLDGLAGWLGAEVITIPVEERQCIPSQQGKIRTFHTDSAPLAADAVLATFNQRTIAICNTVDRAQALGAELMAKAPEGTVVKVLHSRFFQSDRRAATDWLITHFGKNRSSVSDVERAILVTTQVVEVGVDVTCETLHTELAPANSLVQRAGRCARFANESGRVIVHALPLHPRTGAPATAPYDIDPPNNLCERTWHALRERDGTVMDYEAEMELLQEVHAEDDRALLEEIERNAPQHQSKMRNAMASHAAYEGRELIRDIDNRQLVLHPDPNADIDYLCKSPFTRESLSIPRTTFFALALSRTKSYAPNDDDTDEDASSPTVEGWLAVEEESGIDWALAVPKADPTAPLPNSEAYMGQPRFLWERVYTPAQLKGELLFAIHPALVRYTPALGLQFIPDGNPTRMSPELPRNQGGRESYTYRLETYAEHIQGLQRVYLSPFADGRFPALRDEIAYTLPRMAARLNITSAELERLIGYLYVAHDVGKLSRGWQEWIHSWQTLVGKPCDPATAYAHTDFDNSREQREWQRTKMGKRPPHAAEGAAACLMLFSKAIKTQDPSHPLLIAMVSAVVRHHAARHEGKTEKAWEAWQPGARKAMEAALEVVGGDRELLTMLRWQLLPLQQFLINPTGSSALAILAYLWCSRLLRLADQRSQVR